MRGKMIKKLIRKSENLYDLKSWIDWLNDVLTLLLAISLPILFTFTFPQFIARGNYFLILLDLVFWAVSLMRAFIPSTAKYFGNIVWVLIPYVLTISFFVVLGPNYARSAWMMLCVVVAAIIYGVRGAMLSSLLNIIILLALFYLCDATSVEWSLARSEGLGHWLMFVGNLTVLCLGTSISVGFLMSRLDRSLQLERNAKEELCKSEKRYRLITENTADLISIIDMNLRFTYEIGRAHV